MAQESDRTSTFHSSLFSFHLPSGLLLLRKAPGLTSFESLNVIKKALSTAKVGHTGTLDKFASGLLVALVGKALKMAPWFSFCDKEYLGQIRFGIETDTLDPEGTIIAEASVPSRETVEAVLPSFRGNILQEPPAYSAIHINGKRAYELSRQGRPPEMKKRPVTIHELALVSWTPPIAEIKVCCSTGTYIRSLARDIGRAAGSCAHLNGLLRTRIGGFNLSEAYDPEDHHDPEGHHDPARSAIVEALRPIDTGVFDAMGLPYIYADQELARRLSQGQVLNELIRKGLLKGLPQASALGVFEKEKKQLIVVLEQKLGQKSANWGYGHVFANP